MNNIINFPKDPELSIELTHTPEFLEAVQKASDYMAILPINNQQNELLNNLLLDVMHAASKGAFIQGFELGKGLF